MVWLPQESFNLGELSPRILGMGSSDNIKKGCKVLENAFLTTTGGAKRRPGTQLLTVLANSDGAYLVPYQASDDSYMLVFSYKDPEPPVQKLYVYNSDDTLVAWNDTLVHGPYAADPIDTQGNHPLSSSSGPIHHFQHENRVYILSKYAPPLYFEKVYGQTPTYTFGIAPVHNGGPQLISYLPDIALTIEDPNPATLDQINATRWLVSDTNLFTKGDMSSTNEVGWNSSSYWANSIWRTGGPSEGMWPQGPSVTAPTAFDGDSSWFEGMEFISNRKIAGLTISAISGEDAYDWTGPYIHDEIWSDCTYEGGSKYEFQYLTALPLAVKEIIDLSDDRYIGRLLTTRHSSNITSRTVLFIIHDQGVAETGDGTGLPDGTHYVLLFNQGYSSFNSTVVPGQTGKAFSLRKLPTDRAGIPKVATFAKATGAATTLNTGDFQIQSETKDFLPYGHGTSFDGTNGTATLGGAVFVAGGAGRAGTTTGAYGTNCTETLGRSYYGPTFNWGYSWSDGTNFPTAGASHQARVFFSGMEEKLQNVVVGSHTGRPDDFIIGSNDSDSLRFVLSNLVGNGIRWLISQQDLLIGSELAEFKMSGTPLTPTNVGVDLQSTFGSRNGMAAQIGTTTMFVTRDGKSIREMGFSDRSNRFESASLTSLAEHLWLGYTRGDTTYLPQEISKIIVLVAPDICVMAIGSTGSFNILSYQRDTGVLGWSPTNLQWYTGATDYVKDISMLSGYPSGNPDRAYMVVNRSGNICIEYMADGNVLDSQDTYTSDSSSVITGLDHLIGKEVQVTQGPSYLGPYTVDSEGEITIGAAWASTSELNVGLPFTFKLTPTVQEIQGRDGFTHGHKRNYDRTLLYFSNTRGVVVAGYELQILPLADQSRPDAIEGWTSIPVLGLYGQNPDLEITHNNPFSVEIQSISTEVSYSD